MALGGWDEKKLVKSPPFQIKKLRSCLKYKLNRWSTKMKKHEIAIVAFLTRRISRQFGYKFANTKYELTTSIL